MRSNTDPLTEDPAELDARAEEEAREVRWDGFVEAIKARKAQLHHWSDVWDEASIAFLGHERELFVWQCSLFKQACIDFAESEGWPAVLQTIARAMREQAKANS